MRKQKFRLFSILLFTYIFSTTKITSAQNVSIEIPSTYFTEHNINDGNKSNVILNDKGTNGYGLFFIGNANTDGTNGTNGYELTINGDTINCNRQLKGYYTNNFLNFQLFPLDSETNITNGVTYQTGGLYYDCNQGGAQYSGVYGYLKWTYKTGTSYPENSHEIRAGVSNGRIRQWSQISPLKIVEYDQYRALTGYFQDYLAKTAIVTADFSAHERVIINYPNDYFSNTKAFSGNRNEIYFNDAGNDGFGLFFLGTGIENGPYEIKDKAGTELSCSGQLDGYYSFSFNDFGMLPLDQATAEYKYRDDYNISVDGGLYYNCRKKGTSIIYTGVYGYVQRNYNYGNIHELRAGINSDGIFINTSPIEVIYSDNFRNTNRTLSGQYHDNLAKTSKTEARFFGDLGIIIGDTEIKASGTLDDPYFEISIADYRNAKIYVKSSKTNTTGYIYLTAFDKNGQQHTGTFDMDYLNSQRKDFGFYEYEETPSNIFGELSPNDLKNGTIYAYLNNGNENWLGIVRFVITGSSDTPDISITFSGTDCSKTGVTITATSSGSIQYAIVEGNSCNSGSNYSFINYPTTGIYLTGAHMGKSICFRAIYQGNTGYNIRQVEGIDNYGPTFSLSNWNGYECQTGELKITGREGVGCSTFTDQYYWNGLQGGDTYNLYNGNIGSIIVKGEIKDALGNTTAHTGQIRWNDAIPEFSGLENDTITYQNIINTTTTLYENLITAMGVIDGECGNSTISKTGDIVCNNNGTGAWIGNGISVTPPYNYSGQVSCVVNFADDEGYIVAGTVTYNTNTIPLDISINNPEACSRSKTITATSNAINMQVRTGNNILVCSGEIWSNYTSGAPLTFSSEDDNGTHICFKATDSLGKISYKKTTINNIDTTPPEISISTAFNRNGGGGDAPEECSHPTLDIEVTDYGCGSGHMTLIISGQTITDRDGQHASYSIDIGDNTTPFDISIIAKDSVGNTSTETREFSPTNVELSATGFSKTLVQSNGSLIATGNWKELTHAQAGDCEKIRIINWSCPDPEGTRMLTGNTTPYEEFKYTYRGNATGSYCKLYITDGETTGEVTANFYDCNQTGVNECIPQLDPIFTGCRYQGQPGYHCDQSKYISYYDIPYDNEGHTAEYLGKYTSGTTARIQINGHGISTLSGYRYTCVEEGRYCSNTGHWDFYNISDNLTNFIQNNNLQPEICKEGYNTENARSAPKKYQRPRPSDKDIFEIDLDGSEGGCDKRDTPYGSINQGTRKVWIELEDINGYTGIASTDEIIYSTQPPIITGYTASDMGRAIGSYTRSNEVPDIINSGNFTAHITVNGADLPNGTSGQNYKYEYGLSSYNLLPGLLWFNNDTLKDWLITHFGNNN